MSRADLMRRPEDLTGPAAELWDETAAILVRMGTLTPETRERFAGACRAHGEWVRLLKEEGPRRRRLAAQRLFQRRIRGFGMTPMDRVRLVQAGKIGREWLPGRKGQP